MTKILVIEDEAILREELVEWLTLEGYDALGAEDGMIGVETALHYLPDLIVCDILMPRLDGYGVLLEVHAHPATAAIPFIFVTARVAHEDIRKGMDLGADDYITKPFTRLELLQAIQSRLAKKAAQESEHARELNQLQQTLTETQENRLLKAKLVAMFSHDFANSLTSILMTNSLLRDYAARMDEARRLAHLNRIEASTRLLLQMLDDLLVIAQMETGNLDLEPELLNAAKFFQRIGEDCQAIYGDRYDIVLESQNNQSVLIDIRLLRLIVANLIANAIKTSPKGSTVRVGLDNQPTACILTVQDQSLGLAEAEQVRLSGAMQQASHITALSATGLELAIVKQAVELLGGSLHLTSQAGVGTTVTVMLPAQRDEDIIGEVDWVQPLDI